MKQILFISLVTLLSSCSTSKTVKKTISQKYYNLSFAPESITKKVINKTEVTIMPIDAKNLNSETYDAAFRDGNYEKEFISTIESWKTKLNSLPKSDRAALQGKINAFDCLSKLERDGKIPPQLSLLLKRRIINENSGRDGSEVESLADLDIIPSDYNPYKVNANYFSVFKLTFENKGSEVEKINIKEFQLTSNEEQLYPLTSEYFEKNLGDRTETIKNSYRLNMPNELIITPGQRISKYIAVPAINTGNEKLQIQFIRNSSVVNFDFSISKKGTEKSYNLEEFQLKYDGEGDDISYNTYYLVSYKDNVSYALRGNRLFVSDEKRDLPAVIYAIGISSISSEIVFGTTESFSFNSLSKNRRKVIFVKQKRDKKTGQY